MIEVETKIKISNPEYFQKKIRSLAKFLKKETKIDDYYTLKSLGQYPQKSLRVRKRPIGFEINFKQRISYIKGVHAKKESEFKVSDIENFLALIKDFGFKKWLRKIKYSETYQIKNNLTIELNKVKDLGWFIEIEYLVPSAKDIQKARGTILEIVRALNVQRRDIVKEGYTKLLWDKSHKKN